MLVCFHDYTSPASAVAVLRLQGIADEGLPVVFEGVEVMGVDVALPITLDVLAELELHHEEAAARGLELRRPRVRPPTVGAHLVGELAEAVGLGAAWRTAAYRGYWEGGVDLADPQTLRALAESAGLDGDSVEGALGDPARRVELRRRMGARRSEGVGGVPVLLAGRTFVSALLPEPDLRALAALG